MFDANENHSVILNNPTGVAGRLKVQKHRSFDAQYRWGSFLRATNFSGEQGQPSPNKLLIDHISIVPRNGSQALDFMPKILPHRTQHRDRRIGSLESSPDGRAWKSNSDTGTTRCVGSGAQQGGKRARRTKLELRCGCVRTSLPSIGEVLRLRCAALRMTGGEGPTDATLRNSCKNNTKANPAGRLTGSRSHRRRSSTPR